VYRALGFHMVSGFFGDTDEFSFLSSGTGAFANRAEAFAAVNNLLPAVQGSPCRKTALDGRDVASA
jgi:hypothetical protein